MLKPIILAAATLAMLAPLAANAGEVQNRLNHEQQRINAGVRGGGLTAGEYNRLDRSQDHIQAERNRDLRRNDGHLTRGEYRSLNRQENRLSDRIYFDRHNRNRQH